jgi:hypothetical protein
MFGYNYRFELNSEKNTIKLAPTFGTMAKTYGLGYGLFAVQMLALAGLLGFFSKDKPADPVLEDIEKRHPE